MHVTSEISILEKILIHFPGNEINQILPSRKDIWLYDDITELDTLQEEFSVYHKLLILFLDTNQLYKNNMLSFDNIESNPCKLNYTASSNVLDVRYELARIFANPSVKLDNIAFLEKIFGLEQLSIRMQLTLLQLFEKGLEERQQVPLPQSKLMDLVNTIISGVLYWTWDYKKNILLLLPEEKGIHLFKPIPNLIFTRDLGTVINQHFIVAKLSNEIRERETFLTRHIVSYWLSEEIHKYVDKNRVLLKYLVEVVENGDFFEYDDKELKKFTTTIEGGDMMLLSPCHLLIGRSERTSWQAINKLIHRVFQKKTGIQLITVVQIDEKRAQMHIDTVFTQVNEFTWMLYGRLSNKIFLENIQNNKQFVNAQILQQLKQVNYHFKNAELKLYQFYDHGTREQTDKENNSKIDFFVYDKNDLASLDITEKQKKKKIIYDALPPHIAYKKNMDMESFFEQIATVEYKKQKDQARFIYSGDNIFPFDEREQWFDACNVLSLGRGIVIGYDRNKKTLEAFSRNFTEYYQLTTIPQSNQLLYHFLKKNYPYKASYFIISAYHLFEYIQHTFSKVEEVKDFLAGIENMLITIPSKELSRGRGGPHCMSLPIQRKI